MVITYRIKGFIVHNVLVENGSSTDINFPRAFGQMQEVKDVLQEATKPLCDFDGRQKSTLRKIQMLVSFIYVNNPTAKNIIFDIVNMNYPYNVILGRGTLNAFEAIVHSVYLCMKMSAPIEVILIYESQEDTRRVKE
jgi:hypothetical protein